MNLFKGDQVDISKSFGLVPAALGECGLSKDVEVFVAVAKQLATLYKCVKGW